MKINPTNNPLPLSIGLLSLYLHLPGCHSLKEKRSVVKPILAKVQREFKVSISEVGYQDRWQETFLACVTVSNDATYTHSILQKIYQYVLNNHPQVVIVEHSIEQV